MSDSVKMKLCVLWEDELRQAARLLMVASEIPDGDEHEDARAQAFSDAYRASQVALWGLADDATVVMIGNKDIRGWRGRGRCGETDIRN